MKRRIAIILLLLIGGAVANVAVAWGLLYFSNVDVLSGMPQHLSQPPDSPWAEANRLALAGLTCQVVTPYVLASFTFWELPAEGEIKTFAVRPKVIVRFQFCSGWPVRSLGMEFWRFDGVWAHRGAIVLNDDMYQDRFMIQRSGLPYRPLVKGFIINTLFYALLLCLLFFAPGSARRMLRRRRGQCEKCAYPIGVSSVCTECGAAVRPSL